jgi:hypothetical protein
MKIDRYKLGEYIGMGLLALFGLPFFLFYVLWDELKHGRKRQEFLANFYGESRSGRYKNLFFEEVFTGKNGRVKILKEMRPKVRGGFYEVNLIYLFIYENKAGIVCTENLSSGSSYLSWLRPRKFVSLTEGSSIFSFEKKVDTSCIPIFAYFPELKNLKEIFGDVFLFQDEVVLKGEGADECLMVMLDVLSEMREEVKKAKERVEKAGGIYNFLVGEVLSKSI